MDLNKVSLSGLAVSQPIMTKPPTNRAAFASFSLQVNEQYIDSAGTTKVRSNILRVEGFGKSAESIMSRVQSGLRYYVDGYIRQDQREDRDEVKVRVFSITREDSGDGTVYMQGLRQALEIIEQCRDKDTAVDKLRSLIAAR